MPLIKLNRINNGGEIYLNSDHILFMEIEYKSTTVHMTQNLLYSVEEKLEDIVALVEKTEAERIARGIQLAGFGSKP